MEKNKRLNGEKKIENGTFKLKYGTTNKNNPEAIYFLGSTFISPMYKKDTYEYEINNIRKKLKSTINKNLKDNQIFCNKFIVDFNIAQNGIALNKKSFLSFQLLLRQKQENMKKFLEVKPYAEDFISIVSFELENEIEKNEFIVSKTKK